VTERLRDTGVFSAVALGEQPLGPGDTMDIVATVTESPPRRFGFGAELSTDEGARVSAFWLHRNLFGGAERLRIEGEVRGIGQGELSVDGMDGVDVELRARISRPATFTPDTLAYGEIDLVASMNRRSALSASASRPASNTGSPPSWRAHWASAFGRPGSRTRADRGNATLFYLPGRADVGQPRRRAQPDDRCLHDRHGHALRDVRRRRRTARLTADMRGYLGLRGGRSHGPRRPRAGWVPCLAATSIRSRPITCSIPAAPARFGVRNTSRSARSRTASPPGGRSFGTLSAEVRQALGDTNLGLVLFADAGYVGTGCRVSGRRLARRARDRRAL
jgi:translocation and assembly module TamA